MPLINCPQCNASISDRAAACVKCGCTIQTRVVSVDTPPIAQPNTATPTELTNSDDGKLSLLKKMPNKPVIIAVVGVICLLAAVIVFFVARESVSSQAQTVLPEEPSPHIDLNGSWSYKVAEHNEGLGYYELSSILVIKGENYLLSQERISGRAMPWDHCQIGRLVITLNEIELYPDVERGQMSPWRHSTENNSKYSYTLNGQILTLNNDEVYKKVNTPELQLLIYTGTMSGKQTLTIKMVIGMINSDGDVSESYYMYFRNEKYGPPITLTGNLKNGVLLLTESDDKYNDVASMRFSDFNPNSNNISGIWQDLRTGRSGNKYNIELLK